MAFPLRGRAFMLRAAPIFGVAALWVSIPNAVRRMRRAWEYRKTWRTPVGQDCISLDASLCEWLAPRLQFLAEHHHSYPSESSPEQWADDLRHHAAAFAAYASHWDADTIEAEEAIISAAQESLRWIADNLPTLWD